MVGSLRGGEAHEVPRPDLDLLVPYLYHSVPGEDVEPLLLPVVGVVDEGLFPGGTRTQFTPIRVSPTIELKRVPRSSEFGFHGCENHDAFSSISSALTTYLSCAMRRTSF